MAALCLFICFFAVLYTNAKTNELTFEISRLEKNYSTAQSENTRLNSELDSLVSMSMIDQYAVEKLGMTKMKSNQIKYIDVSQYKQNVLAAAQAVLKQNRQNPRLKNDLLLSNNIYYLSVRLMRVKNILNSLCYY